MSKSFIIGWHDVASSVHATAKEKGWWDDDRNDGEVIALMHAELSEALEALRRDNPKDNHLPFFTSLEVELADVIIRVMDYSAERGLSVAEAVIAKSEYNKTRPRKHGKVF